MRKSIATKIYEVSKYKISDKPLVTPEEITNAYTAEELKKELEIKVREMFAKEKQK